MKKTLLLLLVAASSILAKVELYQEVVIELPTDLWEEYSPMYGYLSSYYKDEELKQECLTYFGDNTTSNGRNFGKCYDGVCQSIIDSNILFYIHYECYLSTYEKGCFAFAVYVLSGATHSVMDVVRDELKHYQKCEYIVKDNLLLDTLLNEMDTLIYDYRDRYYETILSNKNCQENQHLCTPSFSEIQFYLPFYPSYTNETNIYDYIDKLNGKTSIPYSIDFSAQLHIEGDRLVVPQELVGKRFEIIDFKGRLQSKGLLQNNMQLPHTKAILRIQGVRSMLLNTAH